MFHIWQDAAFKTVKGKKKIRLFKLKWRILNNQRKYFKSVIITLSHLLFNNFNAELTFLVTKDGTVVLGVGSFHFQKT